MPLPVFTLPSRRWFHFEFHAWPLPAKVASIAIATPLAVYLYKSASLILFQHELIYLRRLPPGSRNLPFPPARLHGLVAHDIVLPPAVSLSRSLHGRRDPQLHGLLVRRFQDDTAQSSPFPPSSPSDVTVLYLQGNGGNVAHRYAKFRSLLDTLALAGAQAPQIVAVGYRGYGHSRGRPSERGLVRDAQRFLDHCSQLHHQTNCNGSSSSSKIIVYGHSLGGAVALSLLAYGSSTCSDNKIQGVVLENTFTSIKAMLQHWYPRSSPFHHLHPFLRSHWDSLATVDQLSLAAAAPKWGVALIAGEADDMVPHEHMVQLRDKLVARLGPAGGKVAWYPVPGGMHNSTWESHAWRQAWRAIAREWIVTQETESRVCK